MSLKEISLRNLNLTKNDKIVMSMTFRTEDLFEKESLVEEQKALMCKSGKIVFFEALSEDMVCEENNTCILNFANKDKPGINFPNSGRTQEEVLLRKFPNLFHSLGKIKYPIASNEIIVTDYVPIICDKNYKIIDLKDRKVSMFVTVPAPDHYTEKFDFVTVLNKIKNLIIGPIHFCKSNPKRTPSKLVLGAWGCGAFLPSKSIFNTILKKLPREYQSCETYQELIARMFFHVLVELEYARFYDKILFAIPNNDPKNDPNYNLFINVFKTEK